MSTQVTSRTASQANVGTLDVPEDGKLYGKGPQPAGGVKAKDIEDATALPAREIADRIDLPGEKPFPPRLPGAEKKLTPAPQPKTGPPSTTRGGDRSVHAALASDGIQSMFRSSAEEAGLWTKLESTLRDVLGENMDRTFERIGPVRGCHVSPQQLGELLREGGIRDFGTTKTFVEAIRDMFAPAPGSAPTESDSVSSFLNDPSLSLEEKLMLLMAKIAGELDEEIQAKMEEVDRMNGRGKGKKVDAPFDYRRGEDNVSGYGNMDGDSSKQQAETELELLMQRRQQMFQTMQNMLKSLHDTSMSGIRNLKA